MKLYSLLPSDSSGAIRWLLYELKVDFELIPLDFPEQGPSAERRIIGGEKLFEDGDLVFYEPYSSLVYLADKYSDQRLSPSFDDLPKRAQYLQWLFFCSSTFSRTVRDVNQTQRKPDDFRKQWLPFYIQELRRCLEAIEKALEGRNFILESFSPADIFICHNLDWINEEDLFTNYPRIASYFKKISARKACKKAEVFCGIFI